MKTKISIGAVVLLIVTQVNLSCKKDYSCEGCSGNQLPGRLKNFPVANAGSDMVINMPVDSITLDGSGSYDPDGVINSFVWVKISGPVSYTLITASAVRTTVKNLVAGIYQFELTVKDNGGLSDKDTVQVLVDDPLANQPPVARAGPDQTIILPVNVANLDGSGSSDPDNNITNYLWTKLAGPSSYSIVNANAVQTQAIALAQGVYQFELKITDATGFFSKDTVQVAVISPPPSCADCKIVFVSERDGNTEIYTCNIDGTVVRRLTYNSATDDQPAWSPDGKQIAFVSDRTGNPELYIMNADGSNVIRKTFSGSYSQNPNWSPDGTKIVYATLSNGSSNIWVVSVTSGSPSLLFEAPGYDAYPTWSPDGSRIALVSDWMAYDFVYDIYTIKADGTDFTALTGNIFDNIDYLHPRWSPNGTKLALAISQTIGIDQYNTQVGIMNTDGSSLTVVRSGAAPWTRTSWSGNGTRIAYTSLSGSRKDVSWVTADGTLWGTIVTNGWNADWQH